MIDTIMAGIMVGKSRAADLIIRNLVALLTGHTAHYGAMVNQ